MFSLVNYRRIFTRLFGFHLILISSANIYAQVNCDAEQASFRKISLQLQQTRSGIKKENQRSQKT